MKVIHFCLCNDPMYIWLVYLDMPHSIIPDYISHFNINEHHLIDFSRNLISLRNVALGKRGDGRDANVAISSLPSAACISIYTRMYGVHVWIALLLHILN
jgi:hypothetical protein